EVQPAFGRPAVATVEAVKYRLRPFPLRAPRQFENETAAARAGWIAAKGCHPIERSFRVADEPGMGLAAIAAGEGVEDRFMPSSAAARLEPEGDSAPGIAGATAAGIRRAVHVAVGIEHQRSAGI